MRNRRGLTLATVLACLAALVVVLAAVVSTSLSHLNFARKVTNSEHAQNLADAAISAAIDRLVESEFEFGKNGTDEIVTSASGLSDAEGMLRFSSTGEFGGKQSTNNLDSDDLIIGGLGHSVPGRTVHLIARGRVGNTVRWVECLYFKPPFPDGLIATGPVDAKALQLLGVREEGSYNGGDPTSISVEDIRPSNLFSNSSSGANASEPSVKVSSNSEITGSVGAVGAIDVDASTQVGGELLPGSDARAVPEMDIRQKMSVLRANAINVSASGGDLTLDPDWFSQASGGLSVSGDLELSGSALLVDGNLNVGGAITGTGIVLVDGDVSVNDGGSSVSTTEQVAVACTGDFDLRASSPIGNYFQGLVYCEGDFSAKDITVYGATVVNGKRGARGTAILDNVRFIQSPAGVSLVLVRHRGGLLVDPGESVHVGSISLTWRQAIPSSDGYLVDVRAYFSDQQNNDDTQPVMDTPLGWDPPGMFDREAEKSFTNIPVPSRDVAAIEEALFQYQPLKDDFFAHYFGEAGPDWGDAQDRKYRELLRNLANSIVNGDEYTVSFTLNNLLSESMGSSRVLYWRPVTEN